MCLVLICVDTGHKEYTVYWDEAGPETCCGCKNTAAFDSPPPLEARLIPEQFFDCVTSYCF